MFLKRSPGYQYLLTKNTPNLTLMGEIWFVFCVYFRENDVMWQVQLYMERKHMNALYKYGLIHIQDSLTLLHLGSNYADLIQTNQYTKRKI